jgi:hypothetical protein
MLRAVDRARMLAESRRILSQMIGGERFEAA